VKSCHHDSIVAFALQAKKVPAKTKTSNQCPEAVGVAIWKLGFEACASRVTIHLKVTWGGKQKTTINMLGMGKWRGGNAAQVDCCLPPACIFPLTQSGWLLLLGFFLCCCPRLIVVVLFPSPLVCDATSESHFPEVLFTILYFSQCQHYNATLLKPLFYCCITDCHSKKIELGGLCLVPPKTNN